VAVQYNFEKNDLFKVDVYDIDDDTNINDVKAHDALGSLEFTLHEVVTQVDQTMKKPLNHCPKGAKSLVKIIAEEVQSNANSELLSFDCSCKLSENSSLYFFIVYKSKGPGTWVPLYKSETRKYGSNGFVQWNRCSLGCTDLANDNVEQEWKVEFFRSETSGKHKNLANLQTTLA